jgi:hypothetical protein
MPLQVRPSLLPLILLVATAPATAATWLETSAEIERLVAANDFDAASTLGTELLEAARETFGEDSRQLADSYLLLGRIDRAAGAFFSAEDNIVAAIEIQRVIDENFDSDPKLTVERLRFASDYVPRRVPASLVQPVELCQALDLVEALDVPDPVLHAGILLDLGDWYLRRGHHDALDRYWEAWNLLGTVGRARRQAIMGRTARGLGMTGPEDGQSPSRHWTTRPARRYLVNRLRGGWSTCALF